MAQLVGRNCVICNERIGSVLEAEFCESCGNSVHRRCLESFQAAEQQGTESGCARCGGRPETAPVVRSSSPVIKPEHCLYALVAVVVLGIVAFLVWPTADSPSEQSSRAETYLPESQGRVPEKNPTVEIETTLGTIRAELFQDKAPQTVQNFVDLVQREFYDGIIFHRVIGEFMIQTGDPLGRGFGGRTDKGLPQKYLPDEFHPDLRHDKPGVLSMANSGPNTGDTQFFITTVPTPWLDDKHSIFGQVVEGMDVVRKIEQVETDEDDRPLEVVKMVRVRILEDE